MYAAASSLLSILHTVTYISPCHSLNLSHPLLLPLCPEVHALYLHLYSCPTNRLICSIFWTSQVALVVKNLPANAGDVRDEGSILGSWRSPRGWNGNPLQYSCLENPMDRGAWLATVHRVTKSWTWLKRLSTYAHRGVKQISDCQGLEVTGDRSVILIVKVVIRLYAFVKANSHVY